MSDSSLQQVMLMLLVWAYKVVTLVIGYLFARLGHDLLRRGITGEFKFRAELKGWKADLASVSPGLFFVLMGAAVVALTVYKGFTIEPTPIQASPPGVQERAFPRQPALEIPRTPPRLGEE